MVHDKIIKECNRKHEEEESKNGIASRNHIKKKVPPVPHNSVKSFADAMNSSVVLSQVAKANNNSQIKHPMDKKESSKSVGLS